MFISCRNLHLSVFYTAFFPDSSSFAILALQPSNLLHNISMDSDLRVAISLSCEENVCFCLYSHGSQVIITIMIMISIMIRIIILNIIFILITIADSFMDLMTLQHRLYNCLEGLSRKLVGAQPGKL